RVTPRRCVRQANGKLHSRVCAPCSCSSHCSGSRRKLLNYLWDTTLPLCLEPSGRGLRRGPRLDRGSAHLECPTYGVREHEPDVFAVIDRVCLVTRTEIKDATVAAVEAANDSKH